MNHLETENKSARILETFKKYDIAIIAAWRNKIVDQDPNCHLIPKYQLLEAEGAVLKREDKEIASYNLMKLVAKQKYGITIIHGGYQYFNNNEQYVKGFEMNFAVANLTNDPLFKENLIKIAAFFNQETIGYIEKGSEDLHWIATNLANRKNNQIVAVGEVVTEPFAVNEIVNEKLKYFSRIRTLKIDEDIKEETWFDVMVSAIPSIYEIERSYAQGMMSKQCRAMETNQYTKLLGLPILKEYWN